MSLPKIGHEKGWRGAFTRNVAMGAYANGSTVVKVNSEENDSHPNGARGKVLGSMSHPDIQDGAVLYFIEWEAAPRTAVATIWWKVQRVQ